LAPGVLEERVIQVDRSVHVKRPDLAGGILERRQIRVVDARGDLRADRDRRDGDPHCDAHANEWLRLHERPPELLKSFLVSNSAKSRRICSFVVREKTCGETSAVTC